MILGVDHIALSCVDLQGSVAAIQRAGYQVKFIEADLMNHSSKKPFLSVYQPVHSVAYCLAESGIAVELTAHGGIPSKSAAGYQPRISKELWRIAGAEPFFDTDYEGFDSLIRSVEVPVMNVEQSFLFWTKGLGAREDLRSLDPPVRARRLRWQSPISRWSLELILRETKIPTAQRCLDDAGFPCLAFLTNDAAADRSRLMELGVSQASEPSRHRVNGKSLMISFLRGPSGELVELIEVLQ